MDLSYSGMRDAVYDILRQMDMHQPFAEEVARKITDEYVVPLLDFVLENLDLNREDLDKAIENKLDQAGA